MQREPPGKCLRRLSLQHERLPEKAGRPGRWLAPLGTIRRRLHSERETPSPWREPLCLEAGRLHAKLETLHSKLGRRHSKAGTLPQQAGRLHEKAAPIREELRDRREWQQPLHALRGHVQARREGLRKRLERLARGPGVRDGMAERMHSGRARSTSSATTTWPKPSVCRRVSPCVSYRGPSSSSAAPR